MYEGLSLSHASLTLIQVSHLVSQSVSHSVTHSVFIHHLQAHHTIQFQKCLSSLQTSRLVAVVEDVEVVAAVSHKHLSHAHYHHYHHHHAIQ